MDASVVIKNLYSAFPKHEVPKNPHSVFINLSHKRFGAHYNIIILCHVKRDDRNLKMKVKRSVSSERAGWK